MTRLECAAPKALLMLAIPLALAGPFIETKEPIMKKFVPLLLVAAIAGCVNTPTQTVADNQPDPTILLIPVQVNDPALASGCWAQFYSQRNFQGNMVTLVGPAEIQTLDKGTARQLKRDIDSVSVGPRAKLEVFENSMFKDRTVSFPANSRVGGLMTRLSFRGRIEAIRLSCS